MKAVGRVIVIALLVAAAAASTDPCDPTLTELDFLAETTPIDAGGECGAFSSEADAVAAQGCSAAAEELPPTICLMLRRGWYKGAKAFVPAIRKDSVARGRVRRLMEEYRAGASDVLSMTNTQGRKNTENSDSDYSLITPAVQWAQNVSCVAVAVRFSPKKHGPVSVASVEDPKVALNETHLTFEAVGHPFQRKPLRFLLELELKAKIKPEESTWSASSNGRLTAMLVKAEPSPWPRLDANETIASDDADPEDAAAVTPRRRKGPISTWYEMAEHFRGGKDAPDEDGGSSSTAKKASPSPAKPPKAPKAKAPRSSKSGAGSDAGASKDGSSYGDFVRAEGEKKTPELKAPHEKAWSSLKSWAGF